MTAQHRPNEVTRETVFRVFQVPEGLRHAIKTRRESVEALG